MLYFFHIPAYPFMPKKDSAKPAAVAEKPARRSPKKTQTEPSLNPHASRELTALAVLAGAVLAGLSLFGAAGVAGGYIDKGLAAFVGLNRWLVPIILTAIAAKIAFPEKMRFERAAGLGLFLFLTSAGGLMNVMLFPDGEAALYLDNVSRGGGYVGLLLGYPLFRLAGYWASLTVLGVIVLASLVFIFNVSLHDLASRLAGLRHAAWPWPFGHRGAAEPGMIVAAEPADEPDFRRETLSATDLNDAAQGDEASEDEADLPSAIAPPRRKRYKPISIPLEILTFQNAKPTSGDIHGRQMSIRKTLENFGIPVEMGEISVGPTVTQFTLKPADGIKLSRLTSLSNDLALSLAAHPIRIEAPIPGRSLVGIEVPNQVIAIVGLREVLDSKEFKARRTNLTICLGKDVSGKPWVADLAKMPHLLVAGATGSGKTVCLNAIILSLLFQNNPDDIKLLLIDPKRVELPVYNGIPHLLTPAVTDVSKTINSLKWAIGEMDRRFEILSQAGQRDIASYNERAKERLPYIIIVIDELADLMVASASEVEASIIRLAQMSRAVGIHLIVATQRPSVDVITGLIKANITCRIAFSVASATDSRTILDSPGAEKLVGRGDMLFLSAELSKPKRIQCCYVSDGDIRHVVDHIKTQMDEPVSYEEGVTEKHRQGGVMDAGYDDNGDELFDEARDTVVRAGKASASYLQRRLKIGYARAARLLDLLEQRGIIGAGDGAKPRAILAASPVEDVDGRHYAEATEDEE